MNNPTYSFQDKVAFVTGSSTGIGRATAMAYARCGARVALIDVNIDENQHTAQMIKEMGGESLLIKCNVADSSEVQESIKKTITVYHRIDFAFNNAGIEGQQGSTIDCSEKNWDQVININLKGVWLCMKYQIPQMLKQGQGSIINCSSIAGLVGFPGIPAYVASKHGVIGLTKTAALEYAKSNIRINAICPGVINTPMIERFTHGEAQIQRQLVESEPLGRIGQPDEIASATLWLSSPLSSFVTGHSLAVDGGWLAQ